MNIKVKSINGKLFLLMNENCLFQELLNDLDKLLDSSLFNKSDYYPKAFFDFKSRNVEENEMIELLNLLNKKQKIIFDGIVLDDDQSVDIYSDKIRNGEEIYVYKKTLFLDVVNPGSFIYCFDDVYFLSKVKGTIVSYNNNIKICGHYFENANIYLCEQSMHNVTLFSLSTIYYKDNKIQVEREDSYE